MANIPETVREQLLAYRTELIGAEQKAQEEYDKTVFALSGGAFGISFAFADNFLTGAPVQPGWLLSAWTAWGLSITAVLFSFFFSNKALRKTVEQVDRAVSNDDLASVYGKTPGGRYTGLTSFLNVIGGLLFFAGAILLVVFVYYNLSGHAPGPAQP